MDEHPLTQLSMEALEKGDGLLGPIEPDPPMDRDDVYNRRGHLVGWLLRLLVRKWPVVFWNEVAWARKRHREGFPSIPVERTGEWLEYDPAKACPDGDDCPDPDAHP